MSEMYFEDHPTDPDKVIIRKPFPVKFFDGPREWVGLTMEEVDGLWEMAQAWNPPKHFYLLVEAKLKEKNT